MEDGELVAKMRARAAQCRRLANFSDDVQTAQTLRAMADEIDADIRHILEAGTQG